MKLSRRACSVDTIYIEREGSRSDRWAAPKKTTLIKLEVTHKLPSESKSLISSRCIELKKILNLVKMAMPFDRRKIPNVHLGW
jgi:hypothetical protein